MCSFKKYKHSCFNCIKPNGLPKRDPIIINLFENSKHTRAPDNTSRYNLKLPTARSDATLKNENSISATLEHYLAEHWIYKFEY